MDTLTGRSLLSLNDVSTDEIISLLDTAASVKKQRAAGSRELRFQGMTLAIIFEKLSTRTRSAFETAFGEEGGHPVFLGSKDIHLGYKETIEDTARVFGRMYDAIAFRGFKQKTAQILAEYAGIPVINALTDDFHPTQALADLLTLRENFGRLEGINLVYIGDGRNNVAHSLIIGSAKTGIRFTCISPKELSPPAEWIESALSFHPNAQITATSDIDAVAGADAVYTDVWVSMGEESEQARREELLAPYQINSALLAATEKESTIFLHCLPAVKGKEVTEEVMEGPQSRVWDQAENRKHTIKAVLLRLLGIEHSA